MNKLVIIRHGLTEWSNRFTGWIDIDIVPEGEEMTKKYALRLKEKGYKFNIGFTSVLKRGIRTLEIALQVLGQENIPIVKDWHLNERNYGDLQGQNKAETIKKYGEKQVKLWRRSYDAAPPNGESLKDTYNRSVPYFQNAVLSEIKKGKTVILSGHHNSLRAIIKFLDNISDQDIINLNVPYCIPLVYEFDENLKPVKHYYLGSDEEVKEVIESIKNQTKN
ncbi:phosphoglyceromutase [Candidatus Roizmanbacteria bacterium CG_4_10_14_0_2_um_filter_36_35]|uniref:2,3-bisphosphoglycerate-dependent phosphoglycerate mutase n=4 Tax=Candidatus Roizmaniibacteriota TaxID=1752723 RepID=A0A2M7BVS3_9BACT|nr:MAG: phosphoglyceromutase [Candidatus Roizmanbacteria bacterium CG11_big_fil_rev_8_21_14_0_20_35_14]PIV10639.1 MAG: phosphoglyceromutase [Candidatus Roizmanbacteria bacterium CG03_land_8_20_14_0_80_35_26]PIZ67080.1 MAG: phosphoglyceromutase [Candidatus Roizmanbacteria bacterium CG_4_10_14_0_2_um_filter_36_35]PJC32386.1 MAG: phosphoglyceromutase [Candidatus Roizmanbacteria bacterium CG_4_9_14_0_2_um_filter_36_12]PJC80193.1 MAG: phosphoglyceromutase [Candidatus Roizmanbacteria bacterium CG_4_8